MVNPRLEFALEQLKPSDWRYFEQFVSEFLSNDFPQLRTTAAASGDRGRDAELVRLDGMPKTIFQYSVTNDWRGKLSQTIQSIAQNFPGVNRLIYCTNQAIGAKVDEIRETTWSVHGIQIDLRDRNWFIERETDTPVRATAADELIERYVVPLLEKRRIVRQITSPLSQDESKVALLQLALNERDRISDQSLTKTSFDALILAALVGTSAESAKPKEEIASIAARCSPPRTPFK